MSTTLRVAWWPGLACLLLRYWPITEYDAACDEVPGSKFQWRILNRRSDRRENHDIIDLAGEPGDRWLLGKVGLKSGTYMSGRKVRTPPE
jgi:hypothetical protein